MRGELWTDWTGGFLAGMMWQFHRRTGSRPGGSGPSITPSCWSIASRPQRPRPGLHLPEHLSAVVRADRRRTLADDVLVQAGPHAGHAIQREGRSTCARFVAPGVAVHRHHDERAVDFLRRPTRRAMRSCSGSPWPIAAPRATAWCAPTAPRPTRASSICRPASFCARARIKGSAPTVAWARGLAWSLYGFSKVYALTGQDGVPRSCRTQCRLLARASAGRQGAVLGFRRRPVAAAAVGTAEGQLRRRPSPPAGCWTWPRQTVARAACRLSRRTALAMLDALGRVPSTWPSTRPAGKASSSTASITRQRKLGVDESVMWGEFFFVEALTKVVMGA